MIMSYISQHPLLIIGVLIIILILLLVAFLLLLLKYRQIGSYDDKSSCPSGFVSQEKHNEILKERDKWYKKCKSLEAGNTDNTDNSDYYKLQDDYEKARAEIIKLNRIIDEQKRENVELNTLLSKAHNEPPITKLGEQTIVQSNQAERVFSPKTETQIIMYASFPRSAGSSSYFSDLTEDLADDSFFELKVSHDTGKASFKPLDFMKIRNYDPAMAAMVTEGVKPNVASTVLGIESGMAHLEGKDWIIDNPAKIKIA